jgi:hypothetical protein
MTTVLFLPTTFSGLWLQYFTIHIICTQLKQDTKCFNFLIKNGQEAHSPHKAENLRRHESVLHMQKFSSWSTVFYVHNL